MIFAHDGQIARAWGRWRGRFLSGGGRRRVALTAPLLARDAGAPGAGSVVPPRSRRLGARPPLPRRRLALGARGALFSTALRVVVGAVASSRVAVAVARRSRRPSL